MNIGTHYPTSIPDIYAVFLLNELMVRGTHDPEVAKQAWDEVGFPVENLDWNDAIPIYLMGVYSPDPNNLDQINFTDYAYKPTYDTIPILLYGNNWPDAPTYFVTQYLSERTPHGSENP